MTADQRAYVKIHPGVGGATHWINAVAMAIMIGSGWRIWNSDPIFDFSFPVAITIGGDPAMSQDVHNELGLAGALQWHFAGMWLLLVNGLVYFAYGIWSGHFRHSLFPLTPSAFVRDALAALTFRLPHRLGIYNAGQKTLYLGVLAAGVVTALTGLAIWKAAPLEELAFLCGGFNTARLIHFLGMAALGLFLWVHVALVLIV